MPESALALKTSLSGGGEGNCAPFFARQKHILISNPPPPKKKKKKKCRPNISARIITRISARIITRFLARIFTLVIFLWGKGAQCPRWPPPPRLVRL